MYNKLPSAQSRIAAWKKTVEHDPYHRIVGASIEDYCFRDLYFFCATEDEAMPTVHYLCMDWRLHYYYLRMLVDVQLRIWFYTNTNNEYPGSCMT